MLQKYTHTRYITNLIYINSINGDFSENLDLDSSHSDYFKNKFYLCCKIIGDNSYHISQKQNSAGNVLFPPNDQYIVNRIIPMKASDDHTPIAHEIINYLNYISRDDKLVLSLDELSKKEEIYK